MRKSGRAKLEWVVPGDALGSTIEPPRPRPSELKEPSPEGLVLDLKADQICGRMECPEIANSSHSTRPPTGHAQGQGSTHQGHLDFTMFTSAFGSRNRHCPRADHRASYRLVCLYIRCGNNGHVGSSYERPRSGWIWPVGH